MLFPRAPKTDSAWVAPRPAEATGDRVKLGRTTMTVYPMILAALHRALDLTDVTMVGHSTGGGEVARLHRTHGYKEGFAAAVLIGAVRGSWVGGGGDVSRQIRTGFPIEVFDGTAHGVG